MNQLLWLVIQVCIIISPSLSCIYSLTETTESVATSDTVTETVVIAIDGKTPMTVTMATLPNIARAEISLASQELKYLINVANRETTNNLEGLWYT